MSNPIDEAIQKAVVSFLAKAAKPNAKNCLSKAKEMMDDAKKARKSVKSLMEDVHKMHKAAYLGKAEKTAKDDKSDEDFDHEGAMEKLHKAYGEIQKMGGFMKAASEHMAKADSIVGEHGEMPGDPVPGIYEVPPGVHGKTNNEMSRQGPGGNQMGSTPPAYPGDGSVYTGKATYIHDLAKANNGMVPIGVAEILAQNAQLQGEVEALRRVPLTTGRRPMSFDLQKVSGDAGISADDRQKTAELFNGVTPSELQSDNELTRNGAVAKVAGNYLLSGKFGKSILDSGFKGGVAGRVQ